MLEVILLGRFELRLVNEPVKLSSRSTQILLSYLLLNRDMVHRRERLAGLLWPDSRESSARQNLRNALWHLRGAIGNVYLRGDKTTLAFNTAAPYSLDVAILEAEPATQDPDELIRVVAVYQGDLLPDLYEDWVLLKRERLRSLFERRMQALLDALLAAGRWLDVQTWAERCIALGHVPEPAYRALMTAHAGLGDLAGVANSYRRCVQALADDLDVPPSEETQALFRCLSEGDTSHVRPSDPMRLRRSTDRETLDPVEEPRSTLPVPYTPFVGRKEELAELSRLLQQDPGCRLLTLLGPGGIGKTRLALEAARGIRFAHGVWFVPLAPLGSSASLVAAIADGLRLRLHGVTEAREQLFAYLGDRQLLLILDSFEHLLSPGRVEETEGIQDSVVLVTELLKRAPRVKILVTSRERLSLSVEWVFNVAGLPFPEIPEGAPGREMESYGAMQLFLQRARQLKRSFAQSTAELVCAARLCQRVEGMPLAIELAAAWINVLGCGDILQEIEHNLHFLRTGLRDYPERHRDMRAVFDASWNRLTEPERQLFRRLSVFRGGFTRAAAEAIGGEVPWIEVDLSPDDHGTLWLPRQQPPLLAALARLVDKSFIHYVASGRYEIHELMRQYGAAKLLERPEEERRTRNHHAQYFLCFLVGLRNPRPGERRPTSCRPAPQHKRLRAQLSDAQSEPFKAASTVIMDWLAEEAQERDCEHQHPWVVLMDGQEILWETAAQALDETPRIEVLDLLHATGYLWEAVHLSVYPAQDSCLLPTLSRI